MLRQFSLLILISAILLAASALGCGNGDTPPTSPALSAESSIDSPSNRVLWALYDVTIDPVTYEVDVLPVRTPDFTCNVTRFLQPPSSLINLLSISIQPGTDWPAGYAILDITLRHPFFGLDKLKGFDVWGILMAEASQASQIDPDLIYPAMNETRLLNSDGYTRWWNQVEFTTFGKILGYTEGNMAIHGFDSNSTLNGYKYFADDLAPDDSLDMLSTEERGKFGASPGINTRRYEIQFAMNGTPNFHFKYAISANWAKPSDDWEPDYPIDAYPPEANCQEAYRINITDTGSTAWYVDDGNTGGFVKLDIEVFDWQAPYNPSGVPGELAGLWLEGEIVSAPVDLLLLDSSTIIPGGETSSVVQIELGSLNLTHSGLNEVWIVAQNADPNNYEPQIEGDTSIWDWPDSQLSAYLRTTVDISGIEPQYNPIVIAIDPDEGEIDTIVNATVTGNHFADGCVVELRESDGVFVIEADNELWVDDTEVTCDLDLAGAPLGLYDVVVINPSMLEGSLVEGFNVFETGPEDVIYVDDSNDTGIEDGTMAHPYNTIQEGLAAASVGWEVWVDDSGVDYEETIILTPDVVLISVNWDTDDGDDVATIYHSGTSTIVTGAEGATIGGFKISGGSSIGININGVSTTVKNCHVADFSSSSSHLYGIQVIDSPATIIEDCEISDFHMSASYAPYYGIYLSNSPVTLTGTVVHHMTKSGNYNTRAGIYATGCGPQDENHLDIRHCEVHHIYPTGDLGGSYTATYGIYITGSNEADLFNNIIYSITGGNYDTVFGVRINGSTDVEYVNNVLYDVLKKYYFGTAYGFYISTCVNLDVRNSIINYIRRDQFNTIAYGVHADAESTYTFEYNDVQNCSNGNYHGSAAAGVGCISDDPDFVDPGTDFHLDTGSPCIDTGDPSILDPDSSTSDMGAYGGPGGD